MKIGLGKLMKLDVRAQKVTFVGYSLSCEISTPQKKEVLLNFKKTKKNQTKKITQKMRPFKKPWKKQIKMTKKRTTKIIEDPEDKERNRFVLLTMTMILKQKNEKRFCYSLNVHKVLVWMNGTKLLIKKKRKFKKK